MLENATKMLNEALEGKYAIPHFNINNLEWTKYILEECQTNNSPVILGVSEGAVKYMGGYNVVSHLVLGLVKDLNLSIPVALHLDHGSSYESCKKAIDAGFTSVMIDASKYELEENIKITNEVVNYAKIHNVSVEAEVGHIGGTEDTVSAEIAYAKVADAVKLVKDTNVNFFAPALGSVHGPYKGEPNLNFERMAEISKLTSIPLVLHGGSGIPDELIKKAISCGVSKININTELQIAWADALREFVKKNEVEYDPRKLIGSGEKAIKMAVADKIKLLGSNR